MPSERHERRRYIIGGAVQGVGFRPFVFRLATERGLKGWVQNNASGVLIEIEGGAENIAAFEALLQRQKPPHAVIDHFESLILPPQNDNEFRILASDGDEHVSASILPDLAVCADCLREMNDPENRRARHPFITCTQCGPRYTIMTALPYDRPHTSMAVFKMCPDCRAEYEDPRDRRFHAQPIACAACGPHLELWDAKGEVISTHDEALRRAAVAVGDGKIVALKGLGGFHLIADAANEKAAQLLRDRKHRKAKPFALMYPSLQSAQADCFLSAEEESLLCSAVAPIVLLHHRNPAYIAPAVAPGNPYFGVMLPSTPSHALLLQELQRPVIATSGNRANEPICIDEIEALECLGGIADLFLVHNRLIVNRCDDSIVRIAAGRETILRRGRGYAPLPILMKQEAAQAILAVGGHLKNTVAYARGHRLILSPHIGDLDTPEACAAHEKAADALIGLYREEPMIIAHDSHPDYRSTQMAHSRSAQKIAVQHHYAHALSCMIDNRIDAPCFAVVWDGTGYGDDGTIWGGEFLTITEEGYERAAHFMPFPLPGGEGAIRRPGRSAFGILYILGENTERLHLPAEERLLLAQVLEKKINAPSTSSAGRLFDAVASLCGLSHDNSFEGEAAMALEFAATGEEGSYGFNIGNRVVDWRPMMRQILADIDQQTLAGIIAARFHNTLAEIIVAAARIQPQKRVLLTGGCFQNKLLLEKTINLLRESGFEPFWHRRIPPNDGGIAAGQVLAALKGKRKCA